MRRFKSFVIVLSFVLLACFVTETAGLQQIISVKAATVATVKAKETLRVGATTTIVINNKVAKATYSFQNSATKVVTVDKKGTITGKKVGTASITVKQTYNSKTTVVGTVEVTVRPELEMVKVCENSLVSSGNNYRMKKAIEKAQNGEEVIIAYIGGSITEGYNALKPVQSYGYLAYEYFKKTFGKGDGSNVKFVNAGMAGTPSSLGMVRYERDVVRVAGAEPDILFVEFAVNDGDDTTNGDAYESLVVNALKSEKKPAVVLLFSVFKSKWNLQSRLQPIGEYYNLPMISIKDAVLPELASGALTDAEFFSDQYHPTSDGHQLMADCINHYFDTVAVEAIAESDITIPEEAKVGNSFVGIKMIDSKNADNAISINTGGFSSVDTVLGSFKYNMSLKTFPSNWKHASNGGSKSFTMKLDCKNLVIVYKLSNSKTTGKIDVYVDGVKKETYDGYTGGGWNNPMTKVVFEAEESATHTIEIKMASDSKDKEFSILAFGYTK
jgi:lysophospholipase L1-like esterase